MQRWRTDKNVRDLAVEISDTSNTDLANMNLQERPWEALTFIPEKYTTAKQGF